MSVGGTVLIVDDHARFRGLAKAMLTQAGYTVVAAVGCGLEALEAHRRHRPDFVLLDVRLPDVHGFAVAEKLAQEEDPPAVVMMSGTSAADLAPCLEDVPARGFIQKEHLSPAALAALWR